ncbi:MAG: hypothetical protein N2109_05440 [Fimbriimonadales bacterium]|nr:hypothetical protein [Fimbriimonadales bacterium]
MQIRWTAWGLLLAAGCSASEEPPDNRVANPGFEEGGSTPTGWVTDTVPTKGTLTLEPAEGSSGRLLVLRPGEANTDPNRQLGVGQRLQGAWLRGARLHLAARLAGEGGAKAKLALLALDSKGKIRALALLEGPSGKPEQRERVVELPHETESAVLACLAEGTRGAARFDDVRLSQRVPGRLEAAWSLPPTPVAASVRVDADRVLRTAPRELFGVNTEWIWDGKGLWNAREERFRPEVVEASQRLGIGLIRFPGGTFSDFYHWRDKVGPRAERPRTPAMASGELLEHNVGTPEIQSFAQAVGAGLLFTANAGTGSAQEAADWVRFANRQSKSPRVDWWEIGNELYLNDGSEGTASVTKTPRQYAAIAVEFAKAIRAVDPAVRIGAILNDSFYPNKAYPDWTDVVLPAAAPWIDFVAVHNAYAPVLPVDSGHTLREVYACLYGAVDRVRESLRQLDRRIAALPRPHRDRIGIAVTEWGPMFQITPDGRFTDHCKTLGSALYTAAVLGVFLEEPRVRAANFFALIDPLFIGLLGLREERYQPTAGYLAFQLLAKRFERRVVRTECQTATFDAPAVGWTPATRGVPWVRAFAAVSADGRRMTVALINHHFERSAKIAVELRGFRAGRQARVTVLTGKGVDSHTGTTPFRAPGIEWAKPAEDPVHRRMGLGGPDEVWLDERRTDTSGDRFSLRVPAHSLALVELPRADP